MIQIDGLIFSLQSKGGISSMILQILKNLKNEDLEVIIYDKKIQKLLKEENIKSEVFNKRLFERVRSLNVDKKKIFHSTYYRSLKKKNVYLISTFYDFIHEYYRKDIKSKILIRLKKKLAIQSDIIHCISENTKNDLVNFYGYEFEKKCKVIYPLISNDFYQLKLKLINQILYIGGRQKYKNFQKVVQATSKLKNFNLKIIGGGELNSEEKKFLNENLLYRYSHLENPDNKQLNIEYNQSHCLAYCSNFEGFGIPIVEAMRAGCPVIAKKGSSITEVINNYGLLLEEANVDEISNAIKYLENSIERTKLIESGITNSARFSNEILINQYKNLYKR